MNDLTKNDPPMPGTTRPQTISEVILQSRLQTGSVKPVDPAPGPMQVHREKIEGVVKAATTVVLDMGRQARDELDEVLRATGDHNEHLLEQVADYVSKTEALTTALKVICNELGTAKKQMATATIINPPKRSSGGKS